MDIYSLSRTVTQANIKFVDGRAGVVRGSVRGPFCRFSRTLPTTHQITDGDAVIVDPCYWTPSMPFRYEITLQVDGVDGITRDPTFLWGMRWCVPHKQDLRLNGKRFVVRAIQPKHLEFDLSLLRELSCALMIDSPSDELCESASDLGVVIIDSSTESANLVREMNRHASVHFACTTTSTRSDVLSASYDAHSNSHIIVATEGNEMESGDRPTFVQRQIASGDITDMRRACDSLQRDLAKFGQFAGYVITHA